MAKTLERTRKSTLTPILKWAGGKTWLIPKLTQIYRPHRDKIWFDPFCGGLSLPLAIEPDRAILGDINRWTINLYNCIRSSPEFKAARLHNTKEDFYRARIEFNQAIGNGPCNLERMAQLFYYLNRTCFNGLCRFNSVGEFNTPYGKYRKPALDRNFVPYRRIFQNWQFEHSDIFNSSLPTEDAFIYLDPPYDDGFVGYSGNLFGWEQQQQLAVLTDGIDCPIVISNKATNRIMDLYKSHGFEIEILSAPRSIAANGDRQRVFEILATRNI